MTSTNQPYDSSMKALLKEDTAAHGELLLEYLQPVISMVVYLFKSDVVEPHLKEMSGDEELLNFRFRVVSLWTVDGRQFVEDHAISMYTLLPTMKNVDARVLQQAIDEMIQYYGDDERKLARHIFWFQLFLRRSEMITQEKGSGTP